MTAFTDRLLECPLIAILRGVRPQEAPAIAEALLAAGIRIVEVPLNSPNPINSIKAIAETVGKSMLVGAGTVLDPRDIPKIAAVGGELIVSPHADATVVREAKDLGLVAVPGMATPTEGFRMLDAGADALKLFPAEANPPAVVKAMAAVFPVGTAILPVGGITQDNMSGYLDAGARGFGLGSALYRPGATADEVAAKANEFMTALNAIQKARSEGD
ncbi:MAG: 2-dehydro-3-deoxy-6-phosphogalactonate aldolase [Rhodospirillaceae bacterium]|jgi:2-dehydro-3-deoxyphosphogalactonate aldolase|nr:2-dehydro-3-deoxy-6-phosphogalactonate aldolase [Rhodospirillaceae bacterium]